MTPHPCRIPTQEQLDAFLDALRQLVELGKITLAGQGEGGVEPAAGFPSEWIGELVDRAFSQLRARSYDLDFDWWKGPYPKEHRQMEIALNWLRVVQLDMSVRWRPETWARTEGAEDLKLARKLDREAPAHIARPFDAGQVAALDSILQLLATHRTPGESIPDFDLGDLGDRPKIDGKETDPLTNKQRNVIEALFDAGPSGLSLEELERKSGEKYPARILRELLTPRRERAPRTDHERWCEIISMSGKKQTGYRLRIAWPDHFFDRDDKR